MNCVYSAMKSPFQFGKIVVDEAFTNRFIETDKLINNFESGINTIIVSPRRWGKSSLVKHAAKKINSLDLRNKIVYLDLFQIRDEEEFYTQFSQEVIKATSNKLDDWIKSTKVFLGNVVPQITIGTDPLQDFTLSLNLKQQSDSIVDVLNLPDRIAQQKGFKILVCLDEFQNIGFFKNSLQFQKLIRSVFQQHENVVYVLFGSKRTMLYNLFEHKSMPLYKFGEFLPLRKIDEHCLVQYIIDSFTKTDKVIETGFAQEIVTLIKCHPYYMQQLSHIIWLNTKRKVTGEIVQTAISDLKNNLSILFEKEIDLLSNTQIQFLKAVAAGHSSGLSSMNMLTAYKLGTSANVTKNKRKLIDAEILCIEEKKLLFIDPVFEIWFKEIFL